MTLKQVMQNSIFISIFLILYFIFLVQIYIIPNNYNVSIILFLGFAVIIIGIFYFFIKINSPNIIIIRVKIFNESLIKTVLMASMTLSIFIPPVPFNDFIIIWSQVPILNYFRGFIFLIGALFLPGACIYNLILPKNTIYKRLNIEPFLVKLTIYPIISLIFIGSAVLILDFFGCMRSSFIPFLFFSFMFFYVLDIFLKKFDIYELKKKIIRIKISRNTFIILFIGLGIIIIALGFLISKPYLLAGDRWRAISSAISIGIPNTRTFELSHTYTKYWGCISFGLSVLCGIPYVNTNVLLFIFLYLSITSIYLFTKVLLNNMSEKFCVLSSIFITVLFNPYILIVQFSFHSFAFFTFFNSLTLFLIVIKSNVSKEEQKVTIENKILVILSSLFLVQSLMIYFIPALIGIAIFLLYGLFTSNIKYYLKNFLIFYAFFIFFLLIFDLMSYNFFSFWCMHNFSTFSGLPFDFPHLQPELIKISFTSINFYIILLIILFFLFLFFKFAEKISIIFKKLKLKINIILEKKVKYLTIFIITFISICLLIVSLEDPLFINNFLFQGGINPYEYFQIFYLSVFLSSIGFFGILGIYFSYFCFKENKNLFFFLLLLMLLIIIIASSLILLRWMQYPISLVSNIPIDYYEKLRHWFLRTWYYLMIPLSIFVSISLIKFFQKLKSYNWLNVKSRLLLKLYKKIKSILSLFLISLLIFFSLSKPIITIIYWDNYFSVSNEDAQIIGEVLKKIPKDSQIIISRKWWRFKSYLENDLFLYKVLFLEDEMKIAVLNYKERDEDLYKWHINNGSCGDVKLLYEVDNRKNVILLSNKSNYDNITIFNEFQTPQTNGSISFWLKIDTASENIDAGLYLKIFSENYNEGINLLMNYGHFYYITNSEKYELNNKYDIDKWNYVQIHFDCHQNQKYWNIYLNGIKLNDNISGESNLEFRGNPSNLSKILLSTTSMGKDYHIYFDAFNYSWAPITFENDIYDHVLNNFNKLISYLETMNIQYFILHKEYVYEYQELIDYFYRIKLYQYGNFIIYKSSEI